MFGKGLIYNNFLSHILPLGIKGLIFNNFSLLAYQMFVSMHLAKTELIFRYQWYSNSNIVSVETYGAQSNEKFQLITTYCAPLIP